MSLNSVEEMITERQRLTAELERLKRRVAELSAQIDVHLSRRSQQQPQTDAAQEKTPP